MTRKDYTLIAAALYTANLAVDDDVRVGVFLAARELAEQLRNENPRFDTARFLDACGF